MPNRRLTDWIDTLVNISAATGAQANVSLMTGVAPVNVRRQTLVRSIVQLQLFSVTVAGAWGVQIADVGVGITSQEAFAAGVLADPATPGDQPSRGWIYRTRKVVAQNGIGAQVLYEITVDIRAGRKLDDGECYLILENTAVAGTTFTVRASGIVRQLWMLP